MDEPKRGRGLPAGKYKIIKTNWDKSDISDMECHDTIEKVAVKRKVKKNRVVKKFLKDRVGEIEEDTT